MGRPFSALCNVMPSPRGALGDAYPLGRNIGPRPVKEGHKALKPLAFLPDEVLLGYPYVVEGNFSSVVSPDAVLPIYFVPFDALTVAINDDDAMPCGLYIDLWVGEA